MTDATPTPAPGFDLEADDLGFPLRGPDRPVVQIDGRPTGARLARLGPAGFVLSTAGPRETPPAPVPVRFIFRSTTVGPFAAVADTSAEDASHGVRFQFAQMGARGARDILALVCELAGAGIVGEPEAAAIVTERIVESARLSSTLRALAFYRCTGFVRGADERVVAAHAAAWHDGTDLPSVWSLDGPPPRAPLTFVVAGLMSMFEFRADRFQLEAGLVAVPVPEAVSRVRRRRSRRVRSRGALRVAARHPRWPEVTVEGRLSDVSVGGLGMQSTPAEQLLYPGLVLPDVEVVEGELQGVRLHARVRHVVPGTSGSCGLSLDLGEDARWQSDVERSLHPHTQTRGTWSGHLWDLFRDAGYFNLSGKSGKHFSVLRPRFQSALRRLEDAPRVGCQVAWHSRRGIDGAATAVRAYRHTWFGFHVARRRPEDDRDAQGRQLLRDVHFHLHEHALAQSDLHWMLGYIQAKAYWPRLAHVIFPERHLASGEACLVRFNAWEVSCHPPSKAGFGDLDVGPATPGEVARLLEVVRTTRPRAYCEGLDFVPERVHFQGLEQEWAAAGLERRRQIRVARRRGEPVAAAVLESATEGVHLFGLLDLARLFPLAEGGTDAFGALLDDARGLYHGLGRSTFVYAAEHDSELSPIGLVDLGPADVSLLSMRLLPDLMEHIWEVTSGRDEP